MRLISLALFSILLISGCSGEPTYAKPTSTGVKPFKNVSGDKNNSKTSVDKIGE